MVPSPPARSFVKSALVSFVGPSLPLPEARALSRGVVLPPARQGDVYRALALRPRAIALVDGVFESVPSVWHHEILAALDAGVAVFGGASMGALRAAELCGQGMVGVGQVFQWYRDGVIRDDSEVALVHAGADHGFEPFSVPLVNVRHNAARARAAGVLTSTQARELVRCASEVFYQRRTWTRVLDALAWPAALRARWTRWASSHLEDLKREDARACLRSAAAFVRSAPAVRVSAPRARASAHVRFRRLLDTQAERLAALGERLDADELVDEGLRTLLLAGWARESGLQVSERELAATEGAFWREQRIPPRARAAFLARQGLDPAQARWLFETLALERRVLDSSVRMLNDGPGRDEALVFAACRRGLPT